MPKKEIDCKEILRLHGLGISQDRMTKLLHISKRSVSDVIRSAKKNKIDYKKASGMDNHSLYRKLFPNRRLSEEYRCPPDFERVHEELKEPGASLRSCWVEYKYMCEFSGTDPVQYSTFCAGYTGFCKENNLTNRALLRPGKMCQFTWAQRILEFNDPFGKSMNAYVFVGFLPFSGHVYAELTERKDEDTFIRCCGHMLKKIGGTTGIISILHTRDTDAKRLQQNEVIISERTAEMASAYMVRIQKDATGPADSVAAYILERLETEISCKNIGRLEAALFRTVNDINKAADLCYISEQGLLRPVPENIYDIVSVSEKEVIVQNNSHAKHGGNFYSAPWKYRGKAVQIRYTDTELYLCYKDTCIAEHKRVPDFVKRKYVTKGEHMPPKSRQPEFNRRRLQSWADNTGGNIGAVIRGMFDRVEYEEQAYNTALSLLQIGKMRGYGYLDTVCGKVLSTNTKPTYTAVLQAMQNESDGQI